MLLAAVLTAEDCMRLRVENGPTWRDVAYGFAMQHFMRGGWTHEVWPMSLQRRRGTGLLVSMRLVGLHWRVPLGVYSSVRHGLAWRGALCLSGSAALVVGVSPLGGSWLVGMLNLLMGQKYKIGWFAGWLIGLLIDQLKRRIQTCSCHMRVDVNAQGGKEHACKCVCPRGEEHARRGAHLCQPSSRPTNARSCAWRFAPNHSIHSHALLTPMSLAHRISRTRSSGTSCAVHQQGPSAAGVSSKRCPS
eukprot:scaffold304189_cov19-Tisochrysis_lutea.AAC.1